MSKKSKKKIITTKDTNQSEPKSGSKKVSINTTKKKVTPTVSKRGGNRGATSTLKQEEMIFGRANYIMMAAGVLLIGLGMILMLGGWMPDNNTWDDNIIYSTRRITIAPILILAGLIVEVFAIFKK